MARTPLLITLLFAALLSVSPQSFEAAGDGSDTSTKLFQEPPSDYQTYRVVITLHDDAPANIVGDRIVELMDDSDAANNYKADFDGTVLNGMAGKFASNIIHAIQEEFPEMIKAVEPDYQMKISQQRFTAAPVQKQQPTGNWGQARISQKKFNATQPFMYPDSAGAGVDIYHIDTGIFLGHPDFDPTRVTQALILTPPNPFEGNDDANGHGTHTAGVLVGQKFGVAKKANLKSIKALNFLGRGFMSDILLGVEYATRQHMAKNDAKSVLSMSINGPQSVAVNTAVNAAYLAGVFVVVAAGNFGVDACQFSPSSATGAYTVGAVDQTDTLPAWSNFGPCTNIYAPGLDIRSTWISVVPRGAVAPPGWLDFPAVYLSGTSMAAPYVSAVAALLMSTLPFNDVRYVRSQLNLMTQRNVIQGLPATPKSLNRLLNMRLLLTSYWNRKAKWAQLTRGLPKKITNYDELMLAVAKIKPFKPAATPPAIPTGTTTSAVASADPDEDDVTSAAAENAAFAAIDNTNSAVADATAATLDASATPDWVDLATVDSTAPAGSSNSTFLGDFTTAATGMVGV